uniref:Uncharacterized protein n=1 Tax=Arundo donax TaxID=35708 RepID=A0A0A9DW97_ARUDO
MNQRKGKGEDVNPAAHLLTSEVETACAAHLLQPHMLLVASADLQDPSAHRRRRAAGQATAATSGEAGGHGEGGAVEPKAIAIGEGGRFRYG